MPEYIHKTSGTTYLRYAINRTMANENAKFVSIPIDKAQEIMEESKNYSPSTAGLVPHNNTVRAVALMLCISVEELIARMEAPLPSETNKTICELRNKVSMLSDIGSQVIAQVENQEHELVVEWNKTKVL